MSRGPGPEVAKSGAIAGAAALLAASVLLSRVLGVVRDVVLADFAGISRESDAYNAAFQIPDLLNYLLAGAALSIAFLPLYTQRRGEDPAAAERFFAVVLGNMGALAVAATALLFVFAEPLVALQFPGFDADTRALCTRLTRIVLPAQICFVVGGLVQATLMSRGRFGAAALAPLFYNLGIVAGGLVLAPRMGIEGFAWGALAGAVAGPMLVPVVDAWGRVPLRPVVAPAERNFWGYLWIALPLMVGLSLLTVDEWYDRWFGASLGVGVVAALGFARRLMHAPVAVVGQAIGAAALPALSQLWAEGRGDELNRVVERVQRAALGVGLAAAGATVALAAPGVAVLYQRGAFTGDDTAQVATLLGVFALGVPAWVTQQVTVRAFYARSDTWRPMVIGTGIVLLALPLYWAGGARYGAAGLAGAGALAMSVNAVVLLLWARRLHGAPRFGRLAGTALRSAAVVAPSVWATGLAVAQFGGGGPLLDLAMGGAVYAGLVGAGLWWLGDQELRDALRRVARRLPGRRA